MDARLRSPAEQPKPGVKSGRNRVGWQDEHPPRLELERDCKSYGREIERERPDDILLFGRSILETFEW